MCRILFVSCSLVLLTAFFREPTACGQDGGSGQAEVKRPCFVEGQDPKEANRNWVPVESLSDEFDGDTINADKWLSDPEDNGWGWIGRPPGLFRAENVTIADGKMNVTVSPLPEPLTIQGKQFIYQGAIIRSKHPGRVGWYFEARMKANKTAMSSTFWLITRGGNGMRQELDIQECVGKTSKQTHSWGRNWDQIFHSNLIRTQAGEPGKTQIQKSIRPPMKNYERFYVYAAWWKSPEEIQFFLDGKYAYSLIPDVKWDLPSYIQMAIETYDWNPVPEGGGLVTTGTWEERTTQYDWVRVWKLK